MLEPGTLNRQSNMAIDNRYAECNRQSNMTFDNRQSHDLYVYAECNGNVYVECRIYMYMYIVYVYIYIDMLSYVELAKSELTEL